MTHGVTYVSTLSDDLRTLSYEAALYFYPLVMDVTRRQAINTPAGTKARFGPPNEFQHFRAFPPADLRAVVRPNFDALYSIAWLDLTAGPVILHAPDTDDRYYLLPLLDMWTDVFATPGKRVSPVQQPVQLLSHGRVWSGDYRAAFVAGAHRRCRNSRLGVSGCRKALAGFARAANCGVDIRQPAL